MVKSIQTLISCLFARKDKFAQHELAIYVAGWSLVFSIPAISQLVDICSGEVSHFNWDQFWRNTWMLIPIFFLFILNNAVLLPQLFMKRKKGWYGVVLLGLLAGLWFIQQPPHPRFDEPNRPPMPEMMGHPRPVPEPPTSRPVPPPQPDRHEPPFDMYSLTNIILGMCAVLANFGIKIYIQSLRREVELLNIQYEKIQQELESLKYQISPHFLMNTLNNIQSLIETDPHTAYKTIQQLSKMMRYLLYEKSTKNVELQKEVDFMRNFINLMRIRYPESVKISAEFPTDCQSVHIPPLLLISFIENAFKHGVSYTEKSIISVKLDLSGNKLHFHCSNFLFPKSAGDKKESGIGIKNVQRRLDLIYGSAYVLDISKNDDFYAVKLILPLSPDAT